VRVSKPGFLAYTETRMARAGHAQHLRINLKPVAALDEPVPEVPPASSAPLPASDVERSGPNPWVLVVGGTLTAAGLATGVTLSLLAADNADKVERIGDALAGVTRCREPADDACDELSDAATAHDRQVRWATVSYALGAAAGVSTLVYALLSAASSRGPAASSAASTVSGVQVGVGPHGTELVVRGAF
jgi:hypothetical protein